jgi:hypothetical protein
MTKDVLIALIQKDIRELDKLAQGLYETEKPSSTLIGLAAEKATEVAENLKKLDSTDPEVILPEETIPELPTETTVPEPEEIEVEPDNTSEAELIIPLIDMNEDTEEVIEEIKEPEIVASEEINQSVETEQSPADIEPQKQSQVTSTPQKTLFEPHITPIESTVKPKENFIASRFSNKKVSDIKQVISLADRFRFQRELFGNSSEKMNQYLAQLNNCQSFSEAENLLSDLGWNYESETVSDFMNLVNRLF